METVEFQGQTLSRWRVGPSTFLALPARGARLLHWHVTHGDGSVRDVIHWPEDADFANIAKVRGGNPILFPFCGRTFDRGDQGFWRAPDGIRRPMPQHGFARQGEFKLLWADARGFSAQLIPTADDRVAYPYDYEFNVTYLFDALGLACELTLKNLGRVPIPWSAGHHFYFTLPWHENASRADYAIDLSATERLNHAPDGALVPGPTLASTESLANPDLLDTIHTRLKSNTATFGHPKRREHVRIQLGTTKTPPPDAAFVTWSPDATAPFYCVEPWMGPPNAPEHQRGLDLVPPRESHRFTVTLSLK
jgi:Galactose mutarotase and related enzymes